MNDVEKIVRYCMQNLNLIEAKLSEGYFYNSLILCVIDAIFSIGVNYTSTKKTVIRYCDFYRISRLRLDENFPDIEQQEPIDVFCKRFEEKGAEDFVENIFQNKQRTSSSNGILKAQAVYEFAKVLLKYNVRYFQDINKILNDLSFEKDIKAIAGQKSGISLTYFFMLSGSDSFIKPDRMILRFIEKAISRKVNLLEAQAIIKQASTDLSKHFPQMTPRLLDHTIWSHERLL